jgi:6-phosphogluconolactonase (cycloisomerase 2 family)
MNERKGRHIVPAIILVSLIAAALVVLSQPISAQDTGSLSLVYVESNLGCGSNMTAMKNSIYAWSNSGGILTPVNGSPFLTTGTGVCSPTNVFDPESEVVIQPDGSLLYAINGHTNTVAVMTINSDGSLTPIVGSPFASGGQDPASISLSYNILPGGASQMTIANSAMDPNQTGGTPNIATFTVSGGVPTPTAPPNIALKAGADPTQALSRPKQHFLFVDQFATSLLKSYKIRSNGTLVLNNYINPPSQTGKFLGMTLHPIQNVLYAAVPTTSQLGVYQYDKTTGNLTFSKTVADSGSALCWLVTNTAGTFLYGSENGSATITVWNITHVLTPVQVQHFTVNTSLGGGHPENIGIDPTGAYLYVLDSPVIHVLSINATTGELTEPNAPTKFEPSGEVAIGLAVLQK